MVSIAGRWIVPFSRFMAGSPSVKYCYCCHNCKRGRYVPCLAVAYQRIHINSLPPPLVIKAFQTLPKKFLFSYCTPNIHELFQSSFFCKSSEIISLPRRSTISFVRSFVKYGSRLSTAVACAPTREDARQMPIPTSQGNPLSLCSRSSTTPQQDSAP